MAISRAALVKELMPSLNTLFGAEYSKYMYRYSDPVKPRSKTKNPFHAIATDVLRNLWLAKFGDTPPTVQEVADLHDTDIYQVGAVLFSRNELISTNTQSTYDEVYVLKPHANS